MPRRVARTDVPPEPTAGPPDAVPAPALATDPADLTSTTDAPADVDFYRPVLDSLWDIFGADRLIYGSNWPVSAVAAPLSALHRLATEFARSKGPAAMAKIMRTNATKAYQLPVAAPSLRK